MLAASRSFPTFTVHHAAMPEHAAGAFESVSTPWSIALSLSGHRRCTWSLGGRTIDGDVAPGALQVVAHERVTWHRVREPSRCLELVPGPRLLAEHGGEAALVSLTERRPWCDPVANALAMRLGQAVAGDRRLDELEAEDLAHRLLARALQPGGRREHPALEPRLEAVFELIEARLGEALDLATLALAAGTSVFHFARRFRAATGLAPHAYVKARRMERARDLLASKHVPVAEIARAVGFDSTSHFHRAFRWHHGCTPAMARRH